MSTTTERPAVLERLEALIAILNELLDDLPLSARLHDYYRQKFTELGVDEEEET
jgi:hypothetical protein